MAEWNLDLTAYNLDSIAPSDEYFIAGLASDATEEDDVLVLGKTAIDFPGNGNSETQTIANSKEVAVDLSFDQSNSPSDDSAWASSISTPVQLSPQRADEEIASPEQLVNVFVKEDKDRKRKAEVLSPCDDALLRAASSDSGDGLLCMGGSELLRLRPEDDPLGLFSRDPSTLTPDELRQLKKQRRLIKNRESAQLSRHRRKLHQESLEAQVAQLESDKCALHARLEQLAMENSILKRQLAAVNAATASKSSPAVANAAASTPAPHAPTASSTPAIKPLQSSVLLGVLFASALFFSGGDLRRASPASVALIPRPFSPPSATGSALALAGSAAAPYGAGRPRGRVLLAASSAHGGTSGGGSGEYEPVTTLLRDKKQLLIVTLLDHLVNQIHGGASPSSASGSGSGAGGAAGAALLGRLCERLRDMEVLDACGELTAAMPAVRAEFLHAFRAFNLEFSRAAAEAAAASAEGKAGGGGTGGASVNAEFVFARGPAALDPAPFAVPLPAALPPRPVSAAAAASPAATVGEDAAAAAARLWQGIREQLSASEVGVLCPAAQLLISDVPANPPRPRAHGEADVGAAEALGARITRLQLEVAARATPGSDGNASLSTAAAAPLPPRGDASASAALVAGGGAAASVGAGSGGDGTLSVVMPRRVLEGSRLAARLPPRRAAAAPSSAEEASPLLEVRCRAFDLLPFGGGGGASRAPVALAPLVAGWS